MQVFGLGVHHIVCSHPFGQCQLLVVEVHGNDGGTPQTGTYDGTDADHATADDQYSVDISHFSTVHGMEAHAHGLDQCNLLLGESCGRDNFLPRHGEVFAHGSIALHP